MSDPYKELATALIPDGLQCQFQSAGQMVISRQVGPIWPNRGNSFWVTNVRNQWYLFTWGPVGYAVPATGDMAELCRTCMRCGSSAMAKAPPEIVDKFALVELSEDDLEAVYREMDKGNNSQ
jgi:hypothetical protein